MKRLHTKNLLTVAIGLITAAICAASAHAAPTGLSPQAAQAQGGDAVGAQSYAKHCAVCHGEHREGNPPAFPSLRDISHRLTVSQIVERIHTGKGSMPAFPNLPQEEEAALVRFLTTDNSTANPTTPAPAPAANRPGDRAVAGGRLFQRNCAFCHGRDAAGGETGPDLTRSKLVLADVKGNLISEVVRNGRPEKKMPSFNFSNDELEGLVAFIHQQARLSSHPGGRRGVDVADLQTGNVEAGKQYFNGAGGCVKCHSATGDLAGVATRYEGLQLEEQMLYPRNAQSHATVVLPSGEKITGLLVYRDEFTIGLRDSDGIYRSWPINGAVNRIQYSVDSPVDAHVELFSKYTDADIHNLMAYLQTLR